MSGALPQAVVVFGASGFIGRNVVEALRGQVEVMIGVNASGRPVAGCNQTFGADKLAGLPALPSHSAIVDVAAFCYFASSFGQQQAEILAANQRISETVYRLARNRGIAEVRTASSCAVYPASWDALDDARPLDLNDWPHPGEAAYVWSKRWGEISAEIRGDLDAERDFAFSGDVARAFVESLRLRGVNAAINCAVGRTTTERRLAEAAMAAAGRPRPIKLISPPTAANGGVKARRATANHLREVVPALPPLRGLDEGLRATLDWYRDALRR